MDKRIFFQGLWGQLLCFKTALPYLFYARCVDVVRPEPQMVQKQRCGILRKLYNFTPLSTGYMTVSRRRNYIRITIGTNHRKNLRARITA